MKASHIVRFLKMLGVSNIEVGDEWVKASCPLAYWNHRKADGTPGTDSRPSFGVAVGKKSHYNCFACGPGHLQTLLTALMYNTGKDYDKEQDFLFKHEGSNFGEYEDGVEDAEPGEVLSVLPTVLLKRYSPIHTNFTFCKKRHISEESIKRFHLRYDPTRGRFILPIFDGKNQLVGIRGRATNETTLPKYLEYSEVSPNRSSPKAHGIWFGQQFPPPKNKKLILVEGEIDAIRLWQVTKRDGIWASMGASISREQLKTLEGIRNNPIILFYDNDEAGHKATNKILSHLRGVVPNIFKVVNYAGCKDPAEMCDKRVIVEAFRHIDKCG
jgi:5S rRNA maturation endonuclease (ribonuclease M5)